MVDKEKDFDFTDFTHKFAKAMFDGDEKPPRPEETNLPF